MCLRANNEEAADTGKWKCFTHKHTKNTTHPQPTHQHARTHTHAVLPLYARQHYVTSHAEFQLKLCYHLKLVNG
jgi:hypothetical protein